MKRNFIIDHTRKLEFSELKELLGSAEVNVELAPGTLQQIEKGRDFLESKIQSSKVPVYGVNTGFGSLCDVIIPEKDIEQLQENLVMSHACGAGAEVPEDIVKLMLFLKIRSLSYGNSGVRAQTVQLLCDFLNKAIFPVVYQQGSLGASGDLAPLAHLCLALLGKGEVKYKGARMQASDVLSQVGLSSIKLGAKEGLALLNGTQFMSAYGCFNVIQAEKLSSALDQIACISLEAFDCRIDPFDHKLHRIRPHKGQMDTADSISRMLKGSEIMGMEKKQVQDPYSFRCIPQVHGATKDVIAYTRQVLETEINSVTDNPTLFLDEQQILSGGNFHGQPLALAMDFLCIAVSELASISERRTYLLISGQRGLPAFLARYAGLNSGFMIPQYTAAGIVSMNKQLCTPSSSDSIVSSNGQEDHVSMGANAAVKCSSVIENTFTVAGIELFTATQALDLRAPLQPSAFTDRLRKEFRKHVPFLEKDAILQPYISAASSFVAQHMKA